MIWPICFLINGEGSLIERLRFLVLPLVLVERCQVVEAGGCPGVLRAKYLFIYGEIALIQRLCLLVLPLTIIKQCQFIETSSCIGVIGTQHVLTDGKSA